MSRFAVDPRWLVYLPPTMSPAAASTREGFLEHPEDAFREYADARAFRDVYAAYCRPTDGLDGVTLAPFQVLAAEGRAFALTEPHAWHLAQLAVLSDDLITPTRHRYVDLGSTAEREAAAKWCSDLTAVGGEGMVVKPADLPATRVQPGLKVRGREYLRIIYGPDYTGSLDLLRPLWRVHQAVFAVLALESEPVDPRL